MPRSNGTGPQGFGAGTGRGLGPCGGGTRQGSGRGRRGFNGMGRNINQQDELKDLENEKRAISKRIEDLKKN